MKEKNDLVDINETWLPKRLKEIAKQLEDDYYGNLEQALEDLRFLYSCHIEKLNNLFRCVRQRELRKYGKERKKDNNGRD